MEMVKNAFFMVQTRLKNNGLAIENEHKEKMLATSFDWDESNIEKIDLFLCEYKLVGKTTKNKNTFTSKF